MKRFLCTAAALALLAPAAVLAQGDGRIQTSGGFTAGVQQDEVSNNSSKFNEYRDIRDGFYLYDLNFEALDTETGLYLDFNGKNLIRDDQTIDFGLGKFGFWKLDVNRNETPHNLSNKAMTPFNNQGDGYLAVPALVGLDEAAGVGTPTLVPTTPQMAVNDELVRDYLLTDGVLHRVDIGTQRDKTSASLTISPLEFLKLRLIYTDERKDGNKISYGPIGDRPPRTLNVQLAEPIDYVTRELRAEADLDFDRFQARLAYQLSDFDNEIETLSWDNIFFTPNQGDHTLTALESDGTTRRRVAAVGQRALAPDNRYHNVSGTFGVDLPLASRLAATAAYGWMKQDEKLLPYSTMGFVETSLTNNPDQLAWNDLGRLTRRSADAEIRTKLFNVDYTINPLDRLNLRAFFRLYDLDNETDSDQWRYVTQDTVSSTGGVGYRNFRSNLPYAYEKQNYGLDASYRLAFWRSTLGLGYEREEFDRDFREADTDEDIFRASLSARPTDRVNFRVKYLYGDREGKGYDSRVTDQSYWYTFAQSPATGDRDNPAFAFANHPDLRKFDVSDRERHQVDSSVTVTPVQALDLTASYSYRKDDFDSDVKSTQPLLNFPVDAVHTITDEDRNRSTVGQQLGLLEEKRQNYGLDAHYAVGERWSFSAFANREEIESDIRGMVFNENRRENPSAIAADISNLGAWDDSRYLYNLTMEDTTNTFGAGAGFEIIPGKVKLSTDYTYSRGKVEWDYRGYGTDFSTTTTGQPNWEINQFGFRSPKTVRNNQYTLNASLEYQVVTNLIFGLHYLFDRYSVEDWMQDPEGAWVEEVGSEFFLRDTSRDNRWGNRLVNMGSTLGPSYEAHVGYLTMTYRF